MTYYERGYNRVMKTAGIGIETEMKPYALGVVGKREGESHLGPALGYGLLPAVAAGALEGSVLAGATGKNLGGHARALATKGLGGAVDDVTQYVKEVGIPDALRDFKRARPAQGAATYALKNVDFGRVGKNIGRGSLIGAAVFGGLSLLGNLGSYGTGHALANERPSFVDKIKDAFD